MTVYDCVYFLTAFEKLMSYHLLTGNTQVAGSRGNHIKSFIQIFGFNKSTEMIYVFPILYLNIHTYSHSREVPVVIY